MSALHAPLTEQEFNDGCGHTFRGIPLCEDENGEHVYAYGHRDHATYAAAVNDLDEENGADPDMTAATDVRHLYAITVKPADDPEGWWIQWATNGGTVLYTADTPGSFPLTVVSR